MPTSDYRLRSGKAVYGNTTILDQVLAKPGLVPWGYSQGKENYDRITEAIMKKCNEHSEDPISTIGAIEKIIREFKVGKLYEKRDKAADAGTLGHALAEADIKGLPEPKMIGVPEDIKKKASGCYLAYLEWKDGTRFHLIDSEVPLVSEVHKFGGTLDFIGKTTGGLELVDLKTSKGIYYSMWIQVAGYSILWDEIHPNDKLTGYNILRIGQEGNFMHERWTDLDTEKSIFLLTLQIHNLLKEKGVKL